MGNNSIANQSNSPCEAETLLRETIVTYSSIRDKSPQTIKNYILKLFTYDYENNPYNRANYEKFLIYLKTQCEYSELQSFIAPDFDELYESRFKNKPFYVFLIFSLGFIEGRGFLDLEIIFILCNFFRKGMLFEDLEHFIRDYLKEILENMTCRFYKLVNSLTHETLLPGERLATRYFKDEARNLYRFYSLKENREVLVESVLVRLKKVIGYENLSIAEVREKTINKEHLKKLNKTHQSIFNVVNLRQMYWETFDYYQFISSD